MPFNNTLDIKLAGEDLMESRLLSDVILKKEKKTVTLRRKKTGLAFFFLIGSSFILQYCYGWEEDKTKSAFVFLSYFK